MPFTPPAQQVIFRLKQARGGRVIELPAYFDDISVSYGPNWTSYPEIGRADPKVVYERFSKTLSLSFKVVSESKNDRDKIFTEYLEPLATFATPIYSATGPGFIGDFVIFTIGNIYREEVGYVTSLTYDWDNSEISWDLDRQIPTVTNVTMDIAWVGQKMANSKKNFFSPASVPPALSDPGKPSQPPPRSPRLPEVPPLPPVPSIPLRPVQSLRPTRPRIPRIKPPQA